MKQDPGTVHTHTIAGRWVIDCITRRGKTIMEVTDFPTIDYASAVRRACYLAGRTNAHSLIIDPPYGNTEVICFKQPEAPGRESVHAVWVREVMKKIDLMVAQQPVAREVWTYEKLYDWPFMKAWEEDATPIQAAVMILEETGYPQELLPDLLCKGSDTE